jgi:hypothetical protein
MKTLVPHFNAKWQKYKRHKEQSPINRCCSGLISGKSPQGSKCTGKFQHAVYGLRVIACHSS